MKTPYIYGIIAGLFFVVSIFFAFSAGYNAGENDWKYIGKSMCRYWIGTGAISGGYDLEKINH